MRVRLIKEWVMGCLLALVLGGPGHAAKPNPNTGGRAYGSEVVFFGWSPDSRYVAYNRERRRPPAKRGGQARLDKHRMQRRIKGGKVKGFGPAVGTNVKRLAATKGYIIDEAAVRQVDGMHYEFTVAGCQSPGGTEEAANCTVTERVASLTVEPGPGALVWRFSVDGEVLQEHSFNKLYIGVHPRLFVAPDGEQALLVMHLDTGWLVDAAVFAVPLRHLGRQPEAKKKAGAR